MTTALRSALLVACAGGVAGCGAGSADAAGGGGDRAEYEAVAQQFGEHVLNDDWASAYAMTTAQFQATVSPAQLKADYDGLVREIHEDDLSYRPNRVASDFGSLPADEAEAKDIYDMRVVPPKSTWKAWMAAGIGYGEGQQGIERGIDAWLLLVEDGGQLRIGYAKFEFMD